MDFRKKYSKAPNEMIVIMTASNKNIMFILRFCVSIVTESEDFFNDYCEGMTEDVKKENTRGILFLRRNLHKIRTFALLMIQRQRPHVTFLLRRLQ